MLCMLAVVSGCISGCGLPQAEFSYREKTNELMPEARQAVQQSLLEHFGEPEQSVAWLRVPVDFGAIGGEVTVSSDQALEVKLNGDIRVVDTISDDALKGVGLLWTKGVFQGATTEKRGQEVPVHFTVTHYDPETNSLQYSPRVSSMAPEVGDEFQLVGYGLQAGRKLYMEHCMHCHGVSGDGNGPTAKYLNPLPRDYRLGIFKFKSTENSMKATRDDLKRVVKHGIPGTYMPSFLLLEDDELHAIIEYVLWLSHRGEIEYGLDNEITTDFSRQAVEERVQGGENSGDIKAEFQEFLADSWADTFAGVTERVFSSWEEVQPEDGKPSSAVIFPKKPRPPSTPESRARGRALYLSNLTKCVSCHGPEGLGNGPQTTSYQINKETGRPYNQPGWHDIWGQRVKPRNLTRGIYRGGRRPIDLYRRLAGGIRGSEMPPFNKLSDDQLWDLVNYVMSIPYGENDIPDDHATDAANVTHISN